MGDQKKNDSKTSQAKSGATKTGRPKRSRLGRGLSALVEVPKPVVVEPGPIKSDNQSGGGRDDLGDGRDGRQGGRGQGDGGHGDVVGEEYIQNTNIKLGTVVGGKITGGTPVPRGFGGGGGGGVEGVVGEGVVEISVGLIGVNRDQPRRVFDEGALGSLADSIVEHGLMQPVVVRVKGESGIGGQGSGVDGIRYELIAGERRWRASMLAGLGTIRAIVREVDDQVSAQLALIENVQREDLNSVELAMGYRALSDRYSMTQERIAKVVGVSRSSVANCVRLLELPEEVCGLIGSGVLSAGHGKVLLSLGHPEKQRKFSAKCLKEGWNVRQLQRACDDAVDGVDNEGRAHGARKDVESDQAVSVLRDLEKRVGEELGTRVKIRTDKSRTRGRVAIEFYDLDQFDGLLGRLGVKMEG